MKSIIIERPEAQTKKQRLSQNFLTAFFWLLFFYLIRPFLSLFAWLLGFEVFYDVMIEKAGYRPLLDLLGIYLFIILLIVIIIRLWSLYNLKRYGHNEKRKNTPPDLSLNQTAQYFSLPTDTLKMWRDSRRITLHFNESGHVITGRGSKAVPPAEEHK